MTKYLFKLVDSRNRLMKRLMNTDPLKPGSLDFLHSELNGINIKISMESWAIRHGRIKI